MDEQAFTLDKIMKLFKISKYTAGIYVSRFNICRKRIYMNGYSHVIYLLNKQKIEEINAYMEYLKNARMQKRIRNKRTNKKSLV